MPNCGAFTYWTSAVLEWNDVLLDTAKTDSQLPQWISDANGTYAYRNQTGPTRCSRAVAMVQLAVYNTVVGIQGGYKPYLIDIRDLRVPANVNVEQAIAGAAYTAIDALYTRLARRYCTTCVTPHSLVLALQEVASHFYDIRNPSPSAQYGFAVAQRVLKARRADGSDTSVLYNRPANIGVWHADLLDRNQTPLDPHWGRVRPFVLTSDDIQNSVNVVTPPPGYVAENTYDFNNRSYEAALSEVYLLGAAASAVRTPEQTRNAIFWSYDEGRGTPIRLYNQAVRTVLLRSDIAKDNLVEQARLLLLANLAMADAGIATWLVKYHFALWRPIHAIRLPDNNPTTPQDPNWIPLGKQRPNARVEHCSPPFPAYVSGHSVFGEATFRSLDNYFRGVQCPFELTTDEPTRECRTYSTYDQASYDNARSRVELGVHFRFDADRGRVLGKYVADLVFQKLADAIEERTLFSARRGAGEDARAVTPYEEVDLTTAVEVPEGDEDELTGQGGEDETYRAEVVTVAPVGPQEVVNEAEMTAPTE